MSLDYLWEFVDGLLILQYIKMVDRQALRDITAGLDTVDKVNAVTWPTKPE